MIPVTIVRGVAAPLVLPNIDTDLIIRIERLTAADQSELGDWALEALRYLPNGDEDPDFVLNQDRFRTAPILVTGENFGCGSSREGAVTALWARGVRAILAPSFGDIFYANCFQNGLLPVHVDAAGIEALVAEIEALPDPVTVDLVQQKITTPAGRSLAFDIDPSRREGLLSGLDEVGRTRLLTEDILAWQARDRINRPWVWDTTR